MKKIVLFNLKNKLNEAAEKHDTLNPKLWNKDNTLKEEVKEKIDLIIDEFTSNLKEDEITFNLKDVILVGSNCSYNYNKDSDLDIHLIAENIEAPENLYEKIYSAYRSIFNKKLDIEFYGTPVEIYIETDDTPGIYNGVYSVMQNKWLEEPVAEDIPEIDKEALDKEVKVWEDRYNEIVDSSEKELNEEIENKQLEEIDKYLEDIYDLRKKDMKAGNQYGIGNLVFKEIRNKGYLDKLKDLRNEIVSKELSLESLEENTEKIKDHKWVNREKEGTHGEFKTKKEADAQRKAMFANGYHEDLDERLEERKRIEYRNELSRISFSSVFIQDSGLFNIYNLKEEDADRIVRRIRDLPYIEWVQKNSSGKYDFSKAVRFGQPQAKYYNISGKIKEEI